MRKKSFVENCFLASLAIALIVSSGCDEKKYDTQSGFPYTEVTEADLEEVEAEWQSRDLAAREVELLLEDEGADAFSIRIYKHAVGDNVHYGLVSVPTSGEANYPVVVYLDGLDQKNQEIDLTLWVERAQARLPSAVFVFPLFRGRTMLYKNLHLHASGDFCDAYDGATDDAIALLNVVEQEVEGADLSRVMVRGGSRGGNVALLMGIRDSRVTVVAAASAPVDFYRDSVRRQYGSQYQCQFLTDKTADAARLRMLASSPLHFDLAAGVEIIYLDHGVTDTVVPIWNGDEMANRLDELGYSVDYTRYEVFGHNLGESTEFGLKQRNIYEDFLR